jgi:hypothetical protein
MDNGHRLVTSESTTMEPSPGVTSTVMTDLPVPRTEDTRVVVRILRQNPTHKQVTKHHFHKNNALFTTKTIRSATDCDTDA